MRNWELQNDISTAKAVETNISRGHLSQILSFKRRSVVTAPKVKQAWTRKMPDIYFTFGPARSYYLFAGRTTRFVNVPEQFKRYVLESLDAPEKRLLKPQCIGLGPTEAEYYAMYTTWENKDRYTYDFQHSHIDLMNWFKPQSKVPGSHITIGPYRSIYACIPAASSGGTYYSSNIPSTLKTLLDTSSSLPERKFTAHVSLGYDSSWFVLWPNGDVSWEFNGQYNELEEILNSLPKKSITYIALNPWAAGQWFLVQEDSTVKYCLPAEWAADVENDISEWQNRYKTVTSSTIKGGKSDSLTKFTGKKGDLVLLEGKREKKDAPPPYEGKKANK